MGVAALHEPASAPVQPLVAYATKIRPALEAADDCKLFAGAERDRCRAGRQI